VLDVISLPSEREWLRTLNAQAPGLHWERLLFCAKESVFKTWYPLTRLELDFHEAEITFDPLTRTFSARLLVPGPVVGGRAVPEFAGRFVARDGLLVTAIHLPAPERAPEPGAGADGLHGTAV
jgi:4'-phosphopantetheinyl transferase EntD